MDSKWDERFMELARHVSQWSKDPSTKVGAVISDSQNRVVSLGYNGFPRGVHDSAELYENRAEKYKRVLHAEQNALSFSSKPDMTDCTVYTYPLAPCHRCALEIIQKGIKRVVSCVEPDGDRWCSSITLSEELFEQAGVSLTIYERTPDGLTLYSKERECLHN